MNKIELNISEILNKAWEPTKKYGIIIAVFVLVISMLTQGMSHIGAPQYSIDPESIQTPEDVVKMLSMLSTSSFMSIVGSLISVVLTAGLVNMVLALTAGRMNEVKLSAYNMPVMTYVNYFVVNIIGGILTVIGTMLCVIPGIFIAVRLSMAQYHAIEHPEDGIIGAIKKSWELTNGNFWNLFLLGVIYVVLCLVGFLACCVGMYFAIAFFMFISAVVYFTLNPSNGTSTPEYESVEATVVNEPVDTEKNEGEYNKNY